MHIRTNLEIFDFALTEEEMNGMRSLDTGKGVTILMLLEWNKGFTAHLSSKIKEDRSNNTGSSGISAGVICISEYMKESKKQMTKAAMRQRIEIVQMSCRSVGDKNIESPVKQKRRVESKNSVSHHPLGIQILSFTITV